MTNSTQTSYEELPYIGQAFAFTHPDHLATVSTFMGLDPPHPDKCRVLEIGCGDGRNLIPMAESLPDATVVGIDLAKSHTDEANRLAVEVGLSNVRFLQMDLMDLPQDFGIFDYIICHGVYSWVPPQVQDRILQLCKDHLSDNGIAFVSFNTLPGWHTRRVIRDMTKLHADAVDTPAQKMRVARQYLEAFSAGISDQSDPYSELIRREVQKAKNHPDFYFFHEHLEEFNTPCYLHEFAARAASHELQYVSDVEPTLTLPVCGAPPIEQFLQSVANDRVGRDQHLDFLTNRTFRKSLLCRQHHSVSLNPLAGRVCDFYVSSGGRLESSSFNLTDDSEIVFRTFDGFSVAANEPLIKSAFLSLVEVSPAKLSCRQLLTEAKAKLGLSWTGETTDAADMEHLTHWLLRTHRNSPASMIHLSCVPARHATTVPEFPKVSPAVRKLAAMKESVTNRRHERLGDDDTYVNILPLLDGSRDQPSLINAVERLKQQELLKPVFPGESGARMTHRLLMNFLQFGLYVTD